MLVATAQLQISLSCAWHPTWNGMHPASNAMTAMLVPPSSDLPYRLVLYFIFTSWRELYQVFYQEILKGIKIIQNKYIFGGKLSLSLIS